MDLGGPRETCVRWGHIGTTWRIQLNDPCAVGMRPFCQITLTTCYDRVHRTDVPLCVCDVTIIDDDCVVWTLIFLPSYMIFHYLQTDAIDK